MARQGAIARTYLFIYNATQWTGWCYCLYLLAKQAAAARNFDGAYAAARDAVCAQLQLQCP